MFFLPGRMRGRHETVSALAHKGHPYVKALLDNSLGHSENIGFRELRGSVQQIHD